MFVATQDLVVIWGIDGSYVGIFVSGFPDLQTPIFCVQCCHLASLESRNEVRVTKRRRPTPPRKTEEGAQGGQEVQEGEESGEKSQDAAAEVHVDSCGVETESDPKAADSGDETISFGPHCRVLRTDS